MRAYADTSFLVRLVLNEAGSQAAMAEFRRLNYPPLYFLPLHALEVTNAIRQGEFHLRSTEESRQRSGIARERDVALVRIERWLRQTGGASGRDRGKSSVDAVELKKKRTLQ